MTDAEQIVEALREIKSALCLIDGKLLALWMLVLMFVFFTMWRGGK